MILSGCEFSSRARGILRGILMQKPPLSPNNRHLSYPMNGLGRLSYPMNGLGRRPNVGGHLRKCASTDARTENCHRADESIPTSAESNSLLRRAMWRSTLFLYALSLKICSAVVLHSPPKLRAYQSTSHVRRVSDKTPNGGSVNLRN